MTPPPQLSLLWPSDHPNAFNQPDSTLDPNAERDLDLATTIKALSLEPDFEPDVAKVLTHLVTQASVIRYRQAVLADLLQHPHLHARLVELFPLISGVVRYQHGGMGRQTSLQKLTWRLGELEAVVQCVQGLHDILDTHRQAWQAEGWLSLLAMLDELVNEAAFQQLSRELPALIETMQGTRSITIGVNLNHRLEPIGATLLSVNDKKFGGSSFLKQLFGLDSDWAGLGKLHEMPKAQANQRPITPQMVPLFRDLAEVLRDIAEPIEQALRRYSRFTSAFLIPLRRDLIFYLGAVKLIKDLQDRGLSLCQPEIRPADERLCVVAESYNLNLALHWRTQSDPLSQRIVTNPVELGDGGRIAILTGPNGGGKTTFMQALGLSQILAQAGLWVPGTAAQISPVDNIFTHYPTEEELSKGTGRFGDEAQRLHEIFSQATRHSLILLNESLASTHAGESLYVAQDIVGVMRLLGLRAIFATHLHKLAENVAQLNADLPGESRLISLVASLIEPDDSADATQRTYKISPGPPMGRSYARELANRYGVSYEQLHQLLESRGVL
jgi:hypothetical protein